MSKITYKGFFTDTSNGNQACTEQEEAGLVGVFGGIVRHHAETTIAYKLWIDMKDHPKAKELDIDHFILALERRKQTPDQSEWVGLYTSGTKNFRVVCILERK